jgi:hypothetical protein
MKLKQSVFNVKPRRMVYIVLICHTIPSTVQVIGIPPSGVDINPRSVSRYEPSLEKINCWIKQFLKVCGLAPVAVPQSRTVSSYDADTIFLPSREKA